MRNSDSVDKYRLLNKQKFDVTLRVLHEMHKKFSAILSRSRKQAIDRQNVRKNEIHYKSVVYDYFAVTRTHGPLKRMHTNLIGPRCISRILSDFTVELQHVLKKSKIIKHFCLINPYVESLVGFITQMREVADFMNRI